MPRWNSYVAVYDVTEDRERNRVAKILEGFGLRVQYSAFELRLTPSQRQTLIRHLQEVALKTGFVYLYRRAGGHDRSSVGNLPDNPLADDRHAFVVANDSASPPKRRRNSRLQTPPPPPSVQLPNPVLEFTPPLSGFPSSS